MLVVNLNARVRLWDIPIITVNQGCKCFIGLMPGHSVTLKVKLASQILLLLARRICQGARGGEYLALQLEVSLSHLSAKLGKLADSYPDPN